jgi:hypothetical protein
MVRYCDLHPASAVSHVAPFACSFAIVQQTVLLLTVILVGTLATLPVANAAFLQHCKATTSTVFRGSHCATLAWELFVDSCGVGATMMSLVVLRRLEAGLMLRLMDADELRAKGKGRDALLPPLLRRVSLLAAPTAQIVPASAAGEESGFEGGQCTLGVLIRTASTDSLM